MPTAARKRKYFGGYRIGIHKLNAVVVLTADVHVVLAIQNRKYKLRYYSCTNSNVLL